MILRCEMCGTDLGTFEPETLALPLTGSMFQPLGPAFPRPFPPQATWEHLLCPICHKRAMGWDLSSPTLIRPDRLLTPDGYWLVSQGWETPKPAPYVHDSSTLAREWDAAVAAREATRQTKQPPEQPHKGKRR